MGSNKNKYNELKVVYDDLRNHLSHLLHGSVHIESLNIHYDLPPEAISYHHWVNRLLIFVGALALGGAAVGFAALCELAYEQFLVLRAFDPTWIFVLTPTGLLLLRYVSEKFFPEAAGSGVPQVIASLNKMKNAGPQLLGLRAAFGKVVGTMGGLACGASIGREGPTVQIGAIILRSVFKRLKTPAVYTERSLILAGGAAGVSAAFNTPIAGIVFAIEELGKAFYEKETSVLLMAIVVSGLLALSFSGPYHYFGETAAVISASGKLWAIPVGLLCGVSGGVFSRLLIKGTKLIKQTSFKTQMQLTFLFGVGIAVIGFLSQGQTFGSGYIETRDLFKGTTADGYFPLAKSLATLLSYWCGIPGGLFSPSLAIGASIGSVFSAFFQPAFQQAFVLFGMVGFLSGVIRSPITSVIIVAEMTNNHNLIFSLLLCAVASYGGSILVIKDSLYHSLAKLQYDGEIKSPVSGPGSGIGPSPGSI
ncbi:MAG: hypothetical protein COT74_08500 [Bdellovibrionales bacterium CG10_big_fil_rev_8_21_14_0_10_45_34]|nr:MAG: hypothetical protein COT74_08500 [Bdellovibrionales bacterium CG10_big_fil_rev_8_21_14_0_10_45_34]